MNSYSVARLPINACPNTTLTHLDAGACHQVHHWPGRASNTAIAAYYQSASSLPPIQGSGNEHLSAVRGIHAAHLLRTKI